MTAKWKRVPIDIGKFQDTLATQAGVHWYEEYGEIPSTGYQWRNYLIVQKQEHPKGWFIWIENAHLEGAWGAWDSGTTKEVRFLRELAKQNNGMPHGMFIPAGQKWSRDTEIEGAFRELAEQKEDYATRGGWRGITDHSLAANTLLHGKKQGYGGRNARKGTFYGERDRGFKTLNIAKELAELIEAKQIMIQAESGTINHTRL